ncbi:hypothetical protein DSO57_1012346 [Entomophthora muscae]|uniref:Uncharacterized protein n=1 Tax=Entomophthora muscae TaxID=34485 RepID=A0ACC2SV22_9FUNG|nr:hypothetical protein DSO57_1012346 [Entomophthora muscae]
MVPSTLKSGNRSGWDVQPSSSQPPPPGSESGCQPEIQDRSQLCRAKGSCRDLLRPSKMHHIQWSLKLPGQQHFREKKSISTDEICHKKHEQMHRRIYTSMICKDLGINRSGGKNKNFSKIWTFNMAQQWISKRNMLSTRCSVGQPLASATEASLLGIGWTRFFKASIMISSHTFATPDLSSITDCLEAFAKSDPTTSQMSNGIQIWTSRWPIQTNNLFIIQVF